MDAAVFLRGVNVNGITVRSADLRSCMLGVTGIEACATVLASGNAAVRTALAPADLRPAVEEALRTRFGYEAWVVVLEIADVADLVERCPFPADDPTTHTYLTLASRHDVLDAFDGAHGEVRLSPVALAWQAPVGSSTDTPLAKALARKQLRESTTTRNVRTLPKLLAAAARL